MNGKSLFLYKIIGLVLLATTASQAAESLPPMSADINQTSLSGISSGGYMTVQFHMAHSQIIKGIGVFAGGPYYCAQNSMTNTLTKCMQPKLASALPNVDELIKYTDHLNQQHQIDDIRYLKSAKILLFSGTKDTVVFQNVMDKLVDFYRYYVKEDNIIYKNNIDAGHAMITNDYGHDCAVNAAPFLNNCGYDGAGEVLQHIYGKLNAPSQTSQGTLYEFDQSEFFKDQSSQISLADTGYVYIPKSCQQSLCRIHVFFHGCKQNFATIKTELINHAGYNRWADTNNFIILYPQTIALNNFTNPIDKNNPYACWDWWGYSGHDYYTKNAPQIKFIMRLLERLSSKS